MTQSDFHLCRYFYRRLDVGWDVKSRVNSSVWGNLFWFREGGVTSLRISYKMLWIRHIIKIPYFNFKLCHIFNHLKKQQPKKKKANYKHQPLNVKVHRARLMRNTGLCFWISRLDSTWPVTNEEVHPKSQTPTFFFFFWLAITHSKYKRNQQL